MTGRVLFLTAFPPRADAAHGGGRSVAQLLLNLPDRWRIGLLALRGEDEQPIDETVRDRCELVEEVPRPVVGRSLSRALRERRRIAILLGGAPSWVAGSSVAAYRSRLPEVVERFAPDVVQLEFHVMGQYAPLLAGSRAARVLVEHDPGNLRDRGSSLRGALARRRRARYERCAIAAVDAVVVFTEHDREALLPLAGETPVVRIPLGTTVPATPLSPSGTAHDVLFVGSSVHPPNVEAARRLVEAIFPRVRERVPGAVLYLVGDRSADALERPGVAVTGRVDDPAVYLDRAAVVVVPVSSGGGMRVKVMEALASGKALVATTLAVEGLELEDGREYVRADTDEELASATVRLLEDPEERRALAERARAWALENLGWQRTVSRFEELWRSLLERA